MAERSTPEEQVRRLYEQAEARTAEAMEDLVGRNSFGELLARMTENAMALTKIGFDVMDLMVRNMRIAGRKDVANLGRQLARTEDKLEMVLQEVERLREEVTSSGRGERSDGARSGRRRSSGSRRSSAKSR